jgi:hypothetical protein
MTMEDSSGEIVVDNVWDWLKRRVMNRMDELDAVGVIESKPDRDEAIGQLFRESGLVFEGEVWESRKIEQSKPGDGEGKRSVRIFRDEKGRPKSFAALFPGLSLLAFPPGRHGPELLISPNGSDDEGEIRISIAAGEGERDFWDRIRAVRCAAEYLLEFEPEASKAAGRPWESMGEDHVFIDGKLISVEDWQRDAYRACRDRRREG